MTLLKGKRVLVTRPVHQADSFVRELTEVGALPVIAPAIRLTSSMDQPQAVDLLGRLNEFDWVVFTSANGVKIFVEAASEAGTLDDLKSRKIAAIGPKTAKVLKELVKEPEVIPDKYISEAIAPALGDVRGKKILLARAVQSSKLLVEALNKSGAIITNLSVYDIEFNLDPDIVEALRLALKPDFLTFTSGTTVHGLKEILFRAGRDWMNSVPAVCIGPVTAAALKGCGVTPFAVAEVYTIEGMIEAIQQKSNRG